MKRVVYLMVFLVADSLLLYPLEGIGSMCNASHTWKSMGNYAIKVKAKDVNGREGEWSEGLVVSMPLVHPYATYPLKALASLLYHLLHLLFPLIFP